MFSFKHITTDRAEMIRIPDFLNRVIINRHGVAALLNILNQNAVREGSYQYFDQFPETGRQEIADAPLHSPCDPRTVRLLINDQDHRCQSISSF